MFNLPHRQVSSRVTSQEEVESEKSLRPQHIAEYVGQEEVVANLRVFIKAALQRHEPVDHILLSGPPGLGKTTFARIVANEMHVNFKSINAPSIEKIGDIACVLTLVQSGRRDTLSSYGRSFFRPYYQQG